MIVRVRSTLTLWRRKNEFEDCVSRHAISSLWDTCRCRAGFSNEERLRFIYGPASCVEHAFAACRVGSIILDCPVLLLSNRPQIKERLFLKNALQWKSCSICCHWYIFFLVKKRMPCLISLLFQPHSSFLLPITGQNSYHRCVCSISEKDWDQFHCYHQMHSS